MTRRPDPQCFRRAVRAGLVALTCLAAPAGASADFLVNVSFTDDASNSHAAYYDALRSATEAAGAIWSKHIVGTGTLDVEVRFDKDWLGNAIDRGADGADTNPFVRNNGTYNVFEPGTVTEIRTGVDPNGATPDVRMAFNSNYLANELWFDPNPASRTAPVPINKTDAVTVMLHELGHALGFNGWRNLTNGTLPGDYESTFDEKTTFDGTNYYFVGAAAMALYGGPVPLTYGNIFHLGNDFPGSGDTPRPGTDLIPDLMNGVVFYSGTRYDVSPLDLAMLSDTGVAIQPAAAPEPSSVVLLGLVGAGYAGVCWTRRRVSATPAA